MRQNISFQKKNYYDLMKSSERLEFARLFFVFRWCFVTFFPTSFVYFWFFLLFRHSHKMRQMHLLLTFFVCKNDNYSTTETRLLSARHHHMEKNTHTQIIQFQQIFKWSLKTYITHTRALESIKYAQQRKKKFGGRCER